MRESMIENILKLEPSLTRSLLDQLSFTTIMHLESDLVERNKVYPKIIGGSKRTDVQNALESLLQYCPIESGSEANLDYLNGLKVLEKMKGN